MVKSLHSAPTLTVHALKSAQPSAFVLGPLSFTLQHGRFYGLIGNNGAGKSTLLQLLAGLLQPTAGQVLLDGRPLQQFSLTERALALAYLEQTPAQSQLITEQLVELALLPEQQLWQADTPAQRARLQQALQQADLQTLRLRRLSNLSGGEQQRAQLCRLQLQQAQILLLDEPTNHLDIHRQHQVLSQLRASGKTVLASFHDVNLAALYCDELLVLQQGQLFAQGPVAEVLTEPLIEQLYQRQCRIGTEPFSQKPVVFFAPGEQ